MPREDRRIIFTYEEAYKALYSLCMQRDMKRPPPGQIDKINIDPDDDKKLSFELSNPQEEMTHKIDYSRDFLAAALMLYCRSLGIPFPKKANKSVDIKEDSVVLRMMI